MSTTSTTANLPASSLGGAGELAGLIHARLIAPGEQVFRTGPLPGPEPIAIVTADGRLRTATGTEFPGPREAISRLEDPRYAPIAWQCFATRERVCLETLRQRTEPEQPGSTRPAGALLPLIGAGLLQAGTDLRFEMTTGRGKTGQRVRLLAVASAQVTGDGWLEMADGALYAAPSPAAAACCGVLTNGWKAWHRADDGRSLLTLRGVAGITPSRRTGR
jgi:Restriction Enzyme Adenine Methylase Associated